MNSLVSMHSIGFKSRNINTTAVFSSISVTSGWNTANLDVAGTTTYNGVTYSTYSFRNGPAPSTSSTTVNSYTLSYTCTSSTSISVLAVGGGGGGSSYAGAGGGAGLVVMTTVTIPAGTNTISISVGAGGAQSPSNNGGYSGSNTTVNFTANSSLNITAFGGGAGASSDHTQSPQNIGGSGGGSGWRPSYPPGTTSNSSSSTTTFANNGGTGSNIEVSGVGAGAGGGGGAGAAGGLGKGGDGIQCTLAGISTFSPSGTAYGTYYWGGGGGGTNNNGGGTVNLNGGLGGGGGGGYISGGTGGGSAINAGGNGDPNNNNNNTGTGGANTGGGGGGQWNGAGGAGGSGIVVLAFPTSVGTLDGLTSATAAPSAAYLVANGNTINGIYWITLPTVGATQVYCILDRAVDGGGWMMAMKATRGTTFQYTSTYWTTINTLNPTDNTRNDGDAKFNTMNYSGASDIMALWPDITTVGGSLNLTGYGCWTWLQNRFTSAGTFYVGTGGNNPATTTVSGITASMTLINWFNTISSARYFIQDAKTWPGWGSSIFSYQDNVRFYGFNYLSNTTPKARWGFGWNNEGALFPSADMNSDDAAGGIGMATNSYSAGDYYGCCGTSALNRSARVELYIRDSSAAPSAPTIGTASISGTTATITFTGVTGASYYTAFSSTGGFSGSSTASPITVTGLITGTYTFTVKAGSSSGVSLASSASNSVTL